MTAVPLIPGMALEVGLAIVILVVLLGGLALRGPDKRRIGVVAAVGLVILLGLAFRVEPGSVLFRGTFVQDELAIFAKRLFLVATILGVLASLNLRAETFARRATEYYVAMLASLLGMFILASARELILLFVAFELMSIPLYVLSGFRKREGEAVEAALKFFLIGTVSSALIAYGLSFIYGIALTTDLAGVVGALQDGHPLLILGMVLALGGLGFKIAAFPFHMWVPDTYEAANTPFVAWLSVAPKAAGFVVMFRLYLESVGDPVLLWVPLMTGLAAVTIVAGNLMAIPQQNIKRLLAYSGIAHIGYMLVGFAAVSVNGVAMMLFYLVAYLFGNMGAFQPQLTPIAGLAGAGRRLRGDLRLQGAGPALARPRAVHAPLPPVPGRHPLRRGLLGQALRLLGGRGAGAVLAGAAGRHSDRGGALLLSARGQAHVHRRPGADAARARAAAPGTLHLRLRGRRRRHGPVPQARRHGRSPRGHRSLLATPAGPTQSLPASGKSDPGIPLGGPGRESQRPFGVLLRASLSWHGRCTCSMKTREV